MLQCPLQHQQDHQITVPPPIRLVFLYSCLKPRTQPCQLPAALKAYSALPLAPRSLSHQQRLVGIVNFMWRLLLGTHRQGCFTQCAARPTDLIEQTLHRNRGGNSLQLAPAGCAVSSQLLRAPHQCLDGHCLEHLYILYTLAVTIDSIPHGVPVIKDQVCDFFALPTSYHRPWGRSPGATGLILGRDSLGDAVKGTNLDFAVHTKGKECEHMHV